MDVNELKSKYLGGMIKAGIPFAVVNLAIICAIYLLWMELGHVAFTSSSIIEMPRGDTSELSRINGMKFWGVSFALAIFPVISIIVSTLAGVASAGINAIRDEKGARVNGWIIGGMMWATVAVVGFVYIVSSFLNLPGSTSLGWNPMFLVIFYVFIAVPVLLILWVFTKFSTIGSLIFVKGNSSLTPSSANMAAIIKAGISKSGRSWIITSVITLAVLWVVLLFYAALIMILNMH